MSTYEISKSSLLSLKAEILRKQQELNKAKVDNELKKKVLKKIPLEIKNKGVEARENNDQIYVDEDLLKQSRSILEYKAKLYETLSTHKQSVQDQKKNKQYLVRFDKKKSVEDLPLDENEPYDEKHSDTDEDLYESGDDSDKDPGERWVDYMDCFGRTRKCMQKDLEYLKLKDKELEKVVEEKKKNLNIVIENQDIQPDITSEEGETPSKSSADVGEASELLSSDMRREILRQQWEKEEEALHNKSDIHYQDLLFGEARTHGTGYYSFSKDEEERFKQQEALKNLRAETEMKQKKSQELRNIREKLLATRLKAARNRIRARMGLPPEEDEPEPTTEESKTHEEKEEEEKKQKEFEEKECLLLKARKDHIRPWDIGKEGVKEHQVMSQKEWVEQKREERPTEFAPPTNYRENFRASVKQNRPEIEEDKTLKFTTKQFLKNKRIDRNRKKYTDLEHEQTPLDHKTLNVQCTLKKNHGSPNFDDMILKGYEEVTTRKNEEKTDLERTLGVQSSPIEGSDISDFDDALLKDYERIKSKLGNEEIDYTQTKNVQLHSNKDVHDHLDFDDQLLRDYEKTKPNAKLGFKQTPIKNLSVDETDFQDNAKSTFKSTFEDQIFRGKGIEIAPPPSYDYYGPNQSKIRKTDVKSTNIEESINAGLKFLRKQVEEKQKSRKSRDNLNIY